MSINRVCISGNLTRDPVLRSTSGGMSVLSMGVAVNDRRKNQQTGQWEDYPNFVDCTLFGTRGEKLAQYLAKGSKVAIEGKLRYRSWNDQQTGQKRSALGLFCFFFRLFLSFCCCCFLCLGLCRCCGSSGVSASTCGHTQYHHGCQ